MYICEGKVVGMNHYVKDGKDNYFAQIEYKSKMLSYNGFRCVSCRVSSDVKLGSSVRVLDDLMRPQVVEE